MKRFLGLGWLLAAITSAAAQPYPSRPITMVVPFGAGGPTDALARIVAQRMSVPLGQTVLVENVTGASGTIGIGRVARAAPDGYTIVLGNWPSFVVAAVRRDQGLRADRAAAEQSVHRSQQERPAACLHQGEFRKTFGRDRRRRFGPACERRVLPESHRDELRVRAVPRRLRRRDARPDRRPYRYFVRPGDQRAAVRAQRAGAPLRDHRQDAACRRAGYSDRGRSRRAGVYISTWFGLRAPKGTAPQIIARLAGATMEALADPAVRARFSDLGQEIPPPEQQTAAALAAHLAAEREKWTPIIKDANIKVE